MDFDKAPFFVTLAVAVAGWAATCIADRISKAPTLEYEIQAPHKSEATPPAEAGAEELVIRLSNLNRTVAFKNLGVVILAPNGTRILEATDIVPIPPAFEGNQPWTFQGDMATFVIPQLHPNWSFRVRVRYVGKHPPVLRLDSEKAIYATQPNWETFIARREFWILLTIAAFWGVVVVAYLAFNFSSFVRAQRRPVLIKSRNPSIQESI